MTFPFKYKGPTIKFLYTFFLELSFTFVKIYLFYRSFKAAEAPAAAEGGICKAAEVSCRLKEAAPGGACGGRKHRGG